MRRLISVSTIALIIIFSFVLTGATSPDRWLQGSKSDYSKGLAEGTSIADDGTIQLAPAIDEEYTSATPHIWSLVRSKEGQILAAGGAEGIIIDQRGNPYHTVEKPEIYAMAVARGGQLYFATSPSGSIYRMTGPTSVEEFFTPRTGQNTSEAVSPPERYIWDMAFDSMGNLYAATGLEGRIYKITPEGNSYVVFDSDEAHITTMVMGPDDTLYFGSDPGGQVFRMDSEGNVFVLYDSEFKEISDLVLADDGSLFFSTVSEDALEMEETSNEDGSVKPMLSRTSSIATGNLEEASAGSAASAIFRVDTSLTVERLWASDREIVYTLEKGNEPGTVIAGSGPVGSIFRLDADGNSRLLHSFRDRQVTALLNTGSKIYAATSNLGGLYTLSTSYSSSGTFTSQVKDTGVISSYGALAWRGSGDIALYTRSGNTSNPDNTWSKWARPENQDGTMVIASPAARYIQWQARLSTTTPGATPVLKSVSVYYLQNNLRPLVKRLAMLPVGITFKEGMDDEEAREIPAEIVKELENHNINASPMSGRGKAIFRKPLRTVLWKADDANGDQLRYTLSIRKLSENSFLPLARGIEENHYTFDTRQFEAGEYVIRLEAWDTPSNTPDRAKSHYLDSRPFTVDNDPPLVNGLEVTVSGTTVTLRFSAEDAVSSLRSARYKINAGEWMPLLPEDGIPDEKNERFLATIENVPAGTHLFSVQVLDEVYNIGASSTTLMVR